MNPTIPAYGKWCAVLDLLEIEANEGRSLAYNKAEADIIGLLRGIPLPSLPSLPLLSSLSLPTVTPKPKLIMPKQVPTPTTLPPTTLPPTTLPPTTLPPVVTKIKKESSSIKALRSALKNQVTYKKAPDMRGLEDWANEQIYEDAALYSD